VILSLGHESVHGENIYLHIIACARTNTIKHAKAHEPHLKPHARDRKYQSIHLTRPDIVMST
jgi:hypothetical protein